MDKPKPRVLRDLYLAYKKDSFSNLEKRINLDTVRIFHIPLLKASKAVIVFGVISYLVFGSVIAPVGQNQLSMAAQSDEERQALEKQLQELETQIDQYQSTIDKYKTQGKGLQSEIKQQ